MASVALSLNLDFFFVFDSSIFIHIAYSYLPKKLNYYFFKQ